MAHDPPALLRQHGIQVTAQRLAVLRAVSAKPHVTADAVADAVRSEIGAISGTEGFVMTAPAANIPNVIGQMPIIGTINYT